MSSKHKTIINLIRNQEMHKNIPLYTHLMSKSWQYNIENINGEQVLTNLLNTADNTINWYNCYWKIIWHYFLRMNFLIYSMSQQLHHQSYIFWNSCPHASEDMYSCVHSSSVPNCKNLQKTQWPLPAKWINYLLHIYTKITIEHWKWMKLSWTHHHGWALKTK